MIPYYGLILWTGTLYGGIKHVRLKDKKKTFVCLAFLSTVLLQSLRAEYVGGDGTINTKTAATLDFSGVAAFLVTNLLLVQCSIAVLLYFCEYRPVHPFPSICDP